MTVSGACASDSSTYEQVLDAIHEWLDGPSLEQIHQRDCETAARMTNRHQALAAPESKPLQAFSGTSVTVLTLLSRWPGIAAGAAVLAGAVYLARSEEDAAVKRLLEGPSSNPRSQPRPTDQEIDSMEQTWREYIRSLNYSDVGHGSTPAEDVDPCLFEYSYRALHITEAGMKGPRERNDENPFRHAEVFHTRAMRNEIKNILEYGHGAPDRKPFSFEEMIPSIKAYGAVAADLAVKSAKFDMFAPELEALLKVWHQHVKELTDDTQARDVDRKMMAELRALVEESLNSIFTRRPVCVYGVIATEGGGPALKLNDLYKVLNKIPANNPHPDYSDPTRVQRQALQAVRAWMQEEWLNDWKRPGVPFSAPEIQR